MFGTRHTQKRCWHIFTNGQILTILANTIIMGKIGERQKYANLLVN